MIERDLSGYGDFKSVFESIVADCKKEFTDLVGDVSIFHKILIDRVADAYVCTLMGEKEESAKKYGLQKEKQEKLQKWLASALSELHSSANEVATRRAFYRSLAEAVKQTVTDVLLRKRIFEALSSAGKKVKIESVESYNESFD